MERNKVNAKEITDLMKERKKYLKYLIDEKKHAIKVAPEGILNIGTSKKQEQYYWKENVSDSSKKYIRKEDYDLVQKLCQRDYDREVLEAAEQELRYLEKQEKRYPGKICDDVYEKLPKQRKKWIQPIEQPLEEYIKEWEEAEYEGKGFRENSPEYYTNKKERVRSKTEILIAHALEKHGIPYRYECPLYLKGYGTVYPDFTVLNKRTGKELYWEHFGRMDDPEYATKVIRKIECYEKNLIFPGEQLLLTYETAQSPINYSQIETNIFRYLIG